jgi:hypothetical protein
MGETKKFTLQGANKKKKLQGGKTKLAHITGGVSTYLPYIYILKKRIIIYICCFF